MPKKIIICSNIAGAGKDTMADYIVQRYVSYEKLSFAKGIYDIARTCFNMAGKDRLLLQQIGEKMREIDPDVWLKYTFKESNLLSSYNLDVVISDLRRKNEYEHAIINGFVPIRVVCNRGIAIQRILNRDGKCDVSLLDNKSETGVREIPMYEIENNGTFDEFYEKIDNFLATLE